MRLIQRALLAAAACLVLGFAVPAVHASNPPPPPPPPGCKTCGGPPLPPTPVATVAPTQVAPEVVRIKLSPTHVRRGHTARLEVAATESAAVTAVVHYRSGKPVTYRSKVPSSGKVVKSWKVPSTAPLGGAKLNVTVESPAQRYATTVQFVVTK